MTGGAAAQSSGGAATTLPPITVETKKKAPAKKAAVQSKGPTAPVSPTDKTASDALPPAETGTSPVKGYVAKSTTTGTKTDTPLKEIPQSISVVGAEQMRDQGVQNLQEAVRYMPGILADGFGYDTRNDFSVIRGTPAAYYIDGLRRTYGYWANTSMIEPYTLERVEVLRGPASMIYGQTPAGGIINGISKLPSATPHGEIGVDYGSYDFKQIRIDTTGPITTDGKWLYRITGLARDADTQVDFVENDRYVIQPSITYRPNSDTTVTLLANLRKDDTGSTQQFLPAEGTLTLIPGLGRVPRSAFMGNTGDYHQVEEQSVSLLVDHKFSDALSIHHGMRYTHTDVAFDTSYPLILTRPRIDTINALLGMEFLKAADSPFMFAPGLLPRVRSIEQDSTDVFNSDTYLTARFDAGAARHTVTAGFDYMRYSTEREAVSLIDNLATPFNIFNPTPGIPQGYLSLTGGFVETSDIELEKRPGQVQTQMGLYLQDQIKVGPWIATLGVRQDWLTIDASNTDAEHEAATTVRGALMYETSFGLNPYVSYSESFTPQVGSVIGDTLFTPFDQRRPAGPKEGEQIEVGFKYQPKGASFAINAAVFDLKESNVVATPDPNVFADLGGASTHVRGFELEVIGRLTRELKVLAAYTYMDGTWDSYPDPLSLKAGTQIEYVPRHMASLWGIYTVQDGPLSGLSFGAGVRYVGSITDVAPILAVDYSNPFDPQTSVIGTNSVTAPAYTLFDAMVAYETKDWRWQLTAQNLEDEYYITTCLAFRGDCGIGQGRTVITSLTYKF